MVNGDTEKYVPAWSIAIEAAESWGIPPWEIVERPEARKWLNRRAIFIKAKARARKEIEKRESWAAQAKHR